MDDNYLYIFEVIGLLLVVTLIYYFWHRNNNFAYEQSSSNIKCEDAKCFIANHE